MNYKINDRRGKEPPKEVCRICGSPQIHSREYGNPTMDCIRYLRSIISAHEGTIKILSEESFRTLEIPNVYGSEED